MNTTYLGIDIAARSFAAALWLDNKHVLEQSFCNDGRGFRGLSRWLQTHLASGVEVGIESTNVYGQKLAQWLHEHGQVVYLLNPAQTAYYAKALGQRNKTDAADARTIASFVALHRDQLTRWQPLAAEQQSLQGLTRGRQQLLAVRQELENQLRTAPAVMRPILAAAVKSIKGSLAKVEEQIATHLRQHPQLQQKVQRLCTIDGVGLITAAIVMAELPPIDAQTDPRAIAAWAGLVPRRWQSGETERPARLSRRGNNYLRNALFMPSLVAKRYNPLLKAYAQQLHQRGKRHGAILGAIAHKLLRIMVGLLKNQQDFDPNWSLNKS
jgi:transposase